MPQEDLNKNKGQIVMARKLGQRFSKMAQLLERSHLLVSMYTVYHSLLSCEQLQASPNTHANQCLMPKASSMFALELYLVSIEDFTLSKEFILLLNMVDERVCVHFYPGETMASECTVRKY